MHLLRNPEIKKICCLFGILTLIAVIGAAWIHILFGAYVFIVCVLLLGIFLEFTYRRYKAISNMSIQLNHILHGGGVSPFHSDSEGELAILSSEILKMTIRLQEQAEQLTKEKSYLSESIENISHQIRTPLTSIQMIIPRLRKETLTTEEKNSYIREMNQLHTRIEWLITALLKIAKLESGTVTLEKKRVLVRDMILKTLQPLEIIMEVKEIKVNLTISEDIAFYGDCGWTIEAIGNIIKNCVEHLPIGGVIDIDAYENSINTMITIADNGIGFEKEDLPFIFQRFYKGKNSSAANVGIGLALSQMIIVQQNGTIKAKNRNPHGAKFEVRFYKGAI